MATLQEIQGERHKWEVDPTRSTRAPEGTRYRLKEKYKKEQRKKSKEAPKRASMKERLSAATATKKGSDTPTKGYGASKIPRVPRQQPTKVPRALAGRKAPSAATAHPRRAQAPKILAEIPSNVDESKRVRILPQVGDTPIWGVGHGNEEEFTKGGKVAKSKGGTVKKKHGGTLHKKKKKNKKTYDNYHGGKLVASLYD